MRLERVDLADVDWVLLDALADRSPFQTRAWLDFLASTQDARPVVARLRDGDVDAGWFTGAVVRQAGLWILGSPFPGWTSGPMGFNLAAGVSRRAAVEALLDFGLRELRCAHVELLDRRLSFHDLDGLPKATLDTFTTFEIDLTRDEDALFGAMSSACRRALRKGERVGVHVEQASGVEFADEYYAQLEDVFAKQELRPPYPVERVRELIRHVEPSGQLLLLRARDAEGESSATAIFPFSTAFGYFWGGASWRERQSSRPNEAIFWHAMRHLKRVGVPLLDLGGGGEYKRKYGGRAIELPFVRRSRFAGLMTMRRVAQPIYWRAATRLRRRRSG